MPDLFYQVFIFAFGLLVGSFLNVCIYRVPLEQSIAYPPSRCPSCENQLKPWDLFPLFSWLFLGGKCRYCKAKISAQYPLVEFITATLFLLIYLKFGISTDLFSLCFLTGILIISFFIDLKYMIIPNGTVLIGLAGGVLLIIVNIFYPAQIFDNAKWWTPLLGMFAGSVPMLLIAVIGLLIYKGEDAIGMGDIKLLAVIGIFIGWKLMFIGLFISVVLAGFISLFLLITKIRGRKDPIPLGPFLAIGTLIAIFYGNQIIDTYFGLLIV